MENCIFLFQNLAQTLINLHKAGLDDPFYQPTHTYVLNPKSITMDELYGGVNKLTLEWHDGLMALTVRHCVQVGILSVNQTVSMTVSVNVPVFF